MSMQTPQKWRPSLLMIVVVVLVIILSLPLASLLLFRFYDSQLVRETEAELISQGAAIAASMKLLIREHGLSETALGIEVEPNLRPKEDERYTPIIPTLDLTSDDISKPRPDAVTSKQVVTETYQKIGIQLTSVLEDTQKITLAGFRVLDPLGNVIAGRAELGQSLAHITEVKSALKGSYKSAIRWRISDNPLPPIASVSRGARIRVFVAMPVIVENRVAGVIYLSRTPSNILKQLYQQRWKVLLAGLFISVATCAIAFIFIRTIKKPIEDLQLRTEQIGKGERDALLPLEKHGSREIADLSRAMLDTSKKLFDRTDYINTFASHVSHELKSPFTSIQGAAELMRDNSDTMSNEERSRFLENILSDTSRLVLLLERLRDLAKADNPILHGSISFEELINELKKLFPKTDIHFIGVPKLSLPIAPENALIVFSNLINNAVEHEASEIMLNANIHDAVLDIRISDNGSGISQANREKVFDLFFTTRRIKNGTGLGLGIVQAILKAHDGEIHLTEPNESKTEFRILISITKTQKTVAI